MQISMVDLKTGQPLKNKQANTNEQTNKQKQSVRVSLNPLPTLH